MDEASEQVPQPFRRRINDIFFRFISVDATPSTYKKDIVPKQNFDHDFASVEFLIKLVQVMIAVVCGGSFSTGMLLVVNSNGKFMIFCNVTITAYIIITSVTILSYVLGFVMPTFTKQLFHVLGVLMFVATSFLILRILVDIDHEKLVSCNEELKPSLGKVINLETQYSMLLVTCVLSFVNGFLYAFDVYWEERKSGWKNFRRMLRK